MARRTPKMRLRIKRERLKKAKRARLKQHLGGFKEDLALNRLADGAIRNIKDGMCLVAFEEYGTLLDEIHWHDSAHGRRREVEAAFTRHCIRGHRGR